MAKIAIVEILIAKIALARATGFVAKSSAESKRAFAAEQRLGSNPQTVRQTRTD